MEDTATNLSLSYAGPGLRPRFPWIGLTSALLGMVCWLFVIGAWCMLWRDIMPREDVWIPLAMLAAFAVSLSGLAFAAAGMRRVNPRVAWAVAGLLLNAFGLLALIALVAATFDYLQKYPIG